MEDRLDDEIGIFDQSRRLSVFLVSVPWDYAKPCDFSRHHTFYDAGWRQSQLSALLVFLCCGRLDDYPASGSERSGSVFGSSNALPRLPELPWAHAQSQAVRH
jgi:hypothetical protein